MKKIISIFLALILCFGAMTLAAYAAEAKATFTGPESVRVGETITLTFQMSGKNIFGISGALEYDADQLELKSVDSKLQNNWMLEVSGNTFVAYDNNLEKPINKATTIFTVKFRVKGNLTVGTKIQVSLVNLKASEGNNDINLSNVKYTASVVPPLSKDNVLSGLTVKNATVNPTFSGSVTEYTAEVPFSVEKLDITAKPRDDKAKVSIDNPKLKAGAVTDVKITVTAENGDKKVYTISVKRGQDPNYVPSGENTLSGISVEGFLISPHFDPNVTDYVIWLPYEVDSVQVSGTASSSLALVKVLGGDDLQPGQDNEIQVICIAENGDQKIYTIIAKRAAAHGEEPTQPTEPTDPTQPTEPEEPTAPPTDPTEPTKPQQDPTRPSEPDTQQPQPVDGAMKPWMLIACASLCLALGLALGVLIGRKMRY
jgi:hypothetical protein